MQNLGLEADAIYISEHVHLCSVGIDFGSSTSHLVFSRLVMQRQGHQLSSRFAVIKREVIGQSPIWLTPYRSATVIDTDALGVLVREAYAAVGLTPEQIDTGAVIITGEAAKKENAAPILDIFSAEAGKFVCASAGPNLEALLAAHGSGAVARSIETDGVPVLNVDMGGGTSKLALVTKGKVTDTAATNVGARLVAWDRDGIITRLEDAGALVAETAGYPLRVGMAMPEGAKPAMAALLADVLVEAMSGTITSALGRQMLITEPMVEPPSVGPVMFSGGVAEFIYDRTHEDFGDLAVYLARAVRERLAAAAGQWQVLDPVETIRATVIGAGQYTVQVSGNTILLSDPALLPLRNVQVLTPRWKGPVSAEAVADAIRRSFGRFDLEEGSQTVALAFHWHHGASYPALRALADGVAAAMAASLAAGRPLILIFDHDVGNLIGQLLKHELGVTNDIISIDQIVLREFDFIDIGNLQPDQGVVPVVVKSLVFR